MNRTDLLIWCFLFKMLCGCHFIGGVDDYPVTRSETLSYFGGFLWKQLPLVHLYSSPDGLVHLFTSGKTETHLQMSFVLLLLCWRHVFPIWSGVRRSRWEKWIALHPTEVCNLSFTFQISGSSVHWNHRIGDLLLPRWVRAVSHLLFMATPRFVMSQLLFTICQRPHCVGKSTWGFQSLIRQKHLKGTNSFLA